MVSALRPNTVLVSIMLANNETGVIQPVKKIASAVRRWKKDNAVVNEHKIFIHTDAAQVSTATAISMGVHPQREGLKLV